MSAWFRSAKPFAIDVTVSIPMLPTYIGAAMTDALAIFARREKEKAAKHGPGCKSSQRTGSFRQPCSARLVASAARTSS